MLQKSKLWFIISGALVAFILGGLIVFFIKKNQGGAAGVEVPGSGGISGLAGARAGAGGGT